MNATTENSIDPTEKNYIGYEALISYLTESKNWSYRGFLNLNQDVIIASTSSLTSSPLTLAKWQNFNVTWYIRFLNIAKELLEPNTFAIVNTEYSQRKKDLQAFWQEVIKECKKKNIVTTIPEKTIAIDKCEKENIVSTIPKDTVIIEECEKKNISITTPEEIIIPEETVIEKCEEKNIMITTAIDEECEKENIMITIPEEIAVIDEEFQVPEKTIQALVKDLFQQDLPAKNTELIKYCYDILHELENKSYAHPFYKCDINKDKVIKYPMDLLTINSKLENNQYTLLEEFEDDIRLIFCNCYTYNDVESKVYYLGKELEAVFNKKWNEKLILHDRQMRELKRVRDNDADTDSPFKKQIRILEQNEDNLVYRHVINKTLLVVSAYESLIAGNITPFIKNLKTFLLTRSKMSLSSADEAVLQAIVEGLLPSKYCIPELSLGRQKGYGRFGYSDIFVLKGTGDNNISLELKYISLVGLIKNQKNNFSTKDLEDLDKTLEKENEEFLLKRLYSYWSKEYKETKQITIGEVLNNGIIQLRSYMNIISKGKPANYSSSGVFDERVKITKSNPNKLKGFVILVVGFRRILWRPVEEVISNYIYGKV
ncbi:hypothetical protein RclHR1_08470001 [Rhizophagus clarus]|uniref:Bromo domain-containing protein n=1 Tax=Rhizophagus clarus TaxID=94130 RepID=A0A2Z6SF88_9GLOM|nr:hypothetical protein RclHR1_08470001 [Rhizophagus clarus]